MPGGVVVMPFSWVLVLLYWWPLLSPATQAAIADEVAMWHPVVIEVTAYTDAGGAPPWGITASGEETGHGTVAGPPSVPFGTKVWIPGYGDGEIQDRGCDITGRRMDVWFEDEEGAREWGRRVVIAWVRTDSWPGLEPSKCKRPEKRLLQTLDT